jgi:hypothetical protein
LDSAVSLLYHTCHWHNLIVTNDFFGANFWFTIPLNSLCTKFLIELCYQGYTRYVFFLSPDTSPGIIEEKKIMDAVGETVVKNEEEAIDTDFEVTKEEEVIATDSDVKKEQEVIDTDFDVKLEQEAFATESDVKKEQEAIDTDSDVKKEQEAIDTDFEYQDNQR